MKHRSFLVAPVGLLLCSATPPASEWPRIEAMPVLDARVDCAEGAPCTQLAGIVPEQAGTPAPIPVPEAPELPEPPRLKAVAVLPESAEEAPAASLPDGRLKVLVSIPQQKAYVFKGEDLVATSPVSTGKRGHETPAGRFRILQKKIHHRSSKYDNAPMPYMQRLTNYGIAIHAGSLPGYPASHGCIRLPRSFAKKLYGMTDHGTRVTITKAKPKSAADALRLA